MYHQSINQMQIDIIKYPKIPVLRRPFVPPLGYVMPHAPSGNLPTDWPAPAIALHQAHIRSPRLVPSEIAKLEPTQRYYQVVQRFALSPTKLTTSPALLELNFETPDLALRCDEYVTGPGQVLTREFKHGSLQYRLRCISLRPGSPSPPLSQWVVQDTVWPEGACLSINNQHLEIRRKSHHGKDLPIDITTLLRAGNSVTMSISRGRDKLAKSAYFLAVEVVEMLGHGEAMEMVVGNQIPAHITLDSIKKSLAGPETNDDEIAMTIGDLAISLADPFTARIFTTPVRGSACLHRECFDLETFLNTRQSKPKRLEQPCMVDVWKCPLCNSDARPYSLRVDGFLSNVRVQLEQMGALDAKAIWVAPDGRWRPKIEDKTGVSSDESSDGEGTARARDSRKQSRAGSKGRMRGAVEVIALDGD